jgi:hypothetical protein
VCGPYRIPEQSAETTKPVPKKERHASARRKKSHKTFFTGLRVTSCARRRLSCSEVRRSLTSVSRQANFRRATKPLTCTVFFFCFVPLARTLPSQGRSPRKDGFPFFEVKTFTGKRKSSLRGERRKGALRSILR